MVIILDRDGVINEDSPDFIKSADQWRAIPSSLTAIAEMNRAGHTVIVTTNQSGVTRGHFSLYELAAVHHKMQTELAAADGHLDGIYFCPHFTDECSCRKPQPGMLRQIAKDFSLDLTKDCVSLGDALRDIQAAQAVGCTAVLVKTGKGAATLAAGKGLDNVPVFDNLQSWWRSVNFSSS